MVSTEGWEFLAEGSDGLGLAVSELRVPRKP